MLLFTVEKIPANQIRDAIVQKPTNNLYQLLNMVGFLPPEHLSQIEFVVVKFLIKDLIRIKLIFLNICFEVV